MTFPNDPGGQVGQGGSAPQHDRVVRRVAALLSVSFLLLALAAVLALIPLPYAVMSPGPVTNTLGFIDGRQIIDVDGAQTYHPSTGKLLFTTVRVSGGPGQKLTAYDLLRAGLDDAEEVYPEEEIFPQSATRESVQKENAAEMEGSQRTAAAVAQRALGREVPVTVLVDDVVKGSPADGLVRADDVLVSVDGTAATSPDVVRQAVRAHKPGEEVALTVRRAGTDVVVRPVTADTDGVATIGVLMRSRYELPIDVTIHAGAVGGPSAGMMFALGIYDVLTEGPLAGDQTIAGTGTIGDDGSVGPIGGIRQKLVGARSAGAEFFLVPADNCADVVGHVPAGLTLAKVGTFDEARAAVEAIAAGRAADLPGCPS